MRSACRVTDTGDSQRQTLMSDHCVHSKAFELNHRASVPQYPQPHTGRPIGLWSMHFAHRRHPLLDGGRHVLASHARRRLHILIQAIHFLTAVCVCHPSPVYDNALVSPVYAILPQSPSMRTVASREFTSDSKDDFKSTPTRRVHHHLRLIIEMIIAQDESAQRSVLLKCHRQRCGPTPIGVSRAQVELM